MVSSRERERSHLFYFIKFLVMFVLSYLFLYSVSSAVLFWPLSFHPNFINFCLSFIFFPSHVTSFCHAATHVFVLNVSFLFLFPIMTIKLSSDDSRNSDV